MIQDENERLVEYAEMTAFNFNSEEFKNIQKDLTDFKEKANNFDFFIKNFMKNFIKAETV